MKRSFFHSRSAKLSSFTLVELLVVMGIIAILAATVAVSAGAVIRAANRTKASNIAVQIQTASMAYYTEYSVYPIPSTLVTTPGADVYIKDNDAPNWGAIIFGLCGNLNPYNSSTTAPAGAVANTRAIAFLSMRKSDVDVNNAPLNPATPNSTTDPYFFIAMDGDYSGVLGDSGAANGILPDFTQSTMPQTAKPAVGVAVWANGNSPTTTNANFWVHTY